MPVASRVRSVASATQVRIKVSDGARFVTVRREVPGCGMLSDCVASESGSGGRQDSGCAQALWRCRGVGGPRADSAQRSSVPGRRRHLPASACRRGPERLVRRTGTRLARFADLRHGSDVLVATGAYLQGVAGSCASPLHLQRAVPAAHRIQRRKAARRAGAPGERGALPHARRILFRRVLGNRRAASLYPPGIRRKSRRRPDANRKWARALGNPYLDRKKRRGASIARRSTHTCRSAISRSCASLRTVASSSVHVGNTRVQWTGYFLGYRGVGRHITERKRAEQEHR